ncbi:MAG: MFS transporter [Candidatus Bathyarchaeota archaeon]|nr:MFS transporter [Candidatus Bathyarchaeota archaeon]
MSIIGISVVNIGEKRKYAWVILAVVILTYFTENFLRSAPSALSPILIEELGLSYGMAGVLFSSYFFLYALMQVPSGILSGVLGPRRTIVTFTLITVVGTLLFYVSHDFWTLILAQLLIGFGSSVFYINAVRLTSEWFPPEKRASALGFLSAATGLGNFASYIGFPLAITLIGGWRPLYLYSGVLMTVAFAANVLFLKENPEAESNHREKSGAPLMALVKAAFMDRRVYPFVAGFVLMSFTWVLMTWLPQFLIDTRGLSYMDVGIVSSAGNIMGIPGCILIALVSDRLRKRKLPLVAFSALSALFVALLLLSGPGTPIIVYAVLVGGIGFCQSIWVLFFPMIGETLPHETSGIAQGLVNGIGTLGFSFLSPIYGALVDATGGYGPSNTIVLAVSVLTTLMFVFFTTETYGGANGLKD